MASTSRSVTSPSTRSRYEPGRARSDRPDPARRHLVPAAARAPRLPGADRRRGASGRRAGSRPGRAGLAHPGARAPPGDRGRRHPRPPPTCPARFAHYPVHKTLAGFDFDFQPQLDRASVAELSTLRFVEERRNVLLLGPPGVGKSPRHRARDRRHRGRLPHLLHHRCRHGPHARPPIWPGPSYKLART